MKSSRKSDSRRKDIIIRRFILILITLVIVAMATIELAVALNIEFTRTFVRKSMGVGSLMWIAIAVTVWVKKFKDKNKSPLWFMILFTVIATGSVAGMYTSIFAAFALWANAVLSIMFAAMIVLTFPQEWRNCAVPAGF